MAQATKDTGLSPEDVERIKAVQKRHAAIDPGCEKLTPEEFINWHPVGGISWEERARRMKAAGIAEPEEVPTLDTQETPVLV
jgi:hypothetical protein